LERKRQGWKWRNDDAERHAQGHALRLQRAVGDGKGTNPEELIAVAHAGCFSMATAFQLSGAGHPPESLDCDASLTMTQIPGGWEISAIHLVLKAKVPGIDNAEFQKLAEGAKANCPVSKVLNAKITLEATLA